MAPESGLACWSFSQGGQDQAVFVELKKTLDEDQSRAMEQLRRSLPLLDYLLSVCRIHFGGTNQ